MLKIAAQFDSADATRFLERAGRALRDALARASQRALLLLEQRVVENIGAPFAGKSPAVAYGTLAGSVFSAPRARPELGGVVAVHAPADAYAAAVEFGARPHFPPVRSLFQWVRAKFALTSQKEIESRAFLVARAIARRGTPGHFMFQRAVESERENVAALFDSEVTDALQQLKEE